VFHSITRTGRIEFGFVAALEREVAGLVRRWGKATLTIASREQTVYWSAAHGAVLVCAGTGSARAYQGAKALLQRFSPRVMVSIGFAGSCTPDIAPGALAVPSRVVVAATGNTYECAFGSGTLVSGDYLAGIAAKQQAQERFAALAIEMEAAGVAAAAAECGSEFAAIKAISDGPQDELDFLLPFVTAEGFATARFLAHVTVRPRLWPRVKALHRNSKLASAALERAVGACCIKHDEFVRAHRTQTHSC